MNDTSFHGDGCVEISDAILALTVQSQYDTILDADPDTEIIYKMATGFTMESKSIHDDNTLH